MKGHQDDDVACDDFTLEAQLNVDADSAAEEYYQMYRHTSHGIQPCDAVTKAQFYINNVLVSGNHRTCIRRAYAQQEYQPALCELLGWSSETLHDILM